MAKALKSIKQLQAQLKQAEQSQELQRRQSIKSAGTREFPPPSEANEGAKEILASGDLLEKMKLAEEKLQSLQAEKAEASGQNRTHVGKLQVTIDDLRSKHQQAQSKATSLLDENQELVKKTQERNVKVLSLESRLEVLVSDCDKLRGREAILDKRAY